MHPILIVDDDSDYRDYLRVALARFGASYATATSARFALRHLRQKPIAAVVTAIVMPDMDGIELTRALRQRHDSTPILALARVGDVSDIYLKAALAVGATFAGRKGEDDIALLAELLDLVELRQRLSPRRRASDAG
ncbi:MAG TPA: response regulator [Alphaproteobacteria bacterium]|nr:response regulator [Alphaproteobacteria bacterium]